MVAVAAPDDDLVSNLPEHEADAASSTARGDAPSGSLDSLKEAEPATGPAARVKTRQSLRNFLQKKSSRSKIFAATGGGAFVGVIGLAIIIFYLMSLLDVPNLMQNITEFQFTRLTRQFGYSVAHVLDEALAYDTTATAQTTSLRELLNKQYTNENLVLKGMQDMEVDKIATNLSIADDLKFHYTGKPGAWTLDSLELNGELFKIPEQTAFEKYVPVFGKWVTFFKGVGFSDAVNTAVKKEVGADGASAIATLIRGSIISRIMRQQFGDIGLVAWQAGALKAYAKDTPQQAELQVNRDTAGAVDQSSGLVARESSIPEVSDAQHQVAEITSEVEHGTDPGNTAKLLDAIKHNGNISAASVAADNALQANIWKSILGVADPVLNISFFSCIVYEGSVENAAPSMNLLSSNLLREWYFGHDIADQAEHGGPPGLAAAVGAYTTKLGDVSKSNVYMRANGGTPDTLATSLSPQVSSMQNFTLLTTLFNNSAMSRLISDVATKSCGVLTDPKVAVLIAAANIAAIIASFGSAGVEEGGAEAAVDGASQVAEESLASRILAVIGNKLAAQGFGGTMQRVGMFLTKNGAITLGAMGATLLAKMYVASNSHVVYNGLEQGAGLADALDAGGNIAANEQAREQLFGRALNCTDLQQNNQLDKTYVAEQNQSRSLADRYFATSNPDSLLMRAATGVYATFGGSLAAPMSNAVTSLFSMPGHAFGFMLNSFSGVADAAMPCSHANYGITQFGWSTDEEKLIDSSTTYLPLENQKVLDNSGKEAAIANDYSYCFGYDYNSNGDGSFDPTDQTGNLVADFTGQNASGGKDGSIGGLLANGDIVRTTDGDIVADQGNCSPQNLGPNNPKYGDLVFRFRIAERYYTTMAQLHNLQTVTN